MNSIALSPLCYYQLHTYGVTTCDKLMPDDININLDDSLVAYAYAPRSKYLEPRLFYVSVVYLAFYDPNNPDNRMCKITLRYRSEILPIQI